MNEHAFEDAVEQLAELHGPLEEFLERVASLFRDEYGTWRRASAVERGAERLRVVTGGWSDNEAIVSALEGTMFHTMCWETSSRGGVHEYLIDPKLYSWEPTFWGAKLIPEVTVEGLHQLPDGRIRWIEQRSALRSVGVSGERQAERRTVTATPWATAPQS